MDRAGKRSKAKLASDVGAAEELAAQGRFDDAIRIYDAVIAAATVRDSPDDLAPVIAQALLSKGLALSELARDDEEMAAYAEVVARFGESTREDTRRIVAWAI